MTKHRDSTVLNNSYNHGSLSLASLDLVIILQFWYQWKQHLALSAASIKRIIFISFLELAQHRQRKLCTTENYLDTVKVLLVSWVQTCFPQQWCHWLHDLASPVKNVTSVVPWQGKFYLPDFLSICFLLVLGPHWLTKHWDSIMLKNIYHGSSLHLHHEMRWRINLRIDMNDSKHCSSDHLSSRLLIFFFYLCTNPMKMCFLLNFIEPS